MRWEGKLEALASGLFEAPARMVLEAGAGGLRCRLRSSRAAGAEPEGAGAVRCRPSALPFAAASLPSALLSLLGADPPPAERRALLGEVARVLAPGAALVVVDHNRPRRRASALAALLRAPAIPGASAAARWRRAAYPTAREVQSAGLAVERLRLAVGERVQLVLARAPGGRASGRR
jgi:hypothetical protein